jgi:hypothetical protein
MKKRRHHYVWQHYLQAWARSERVACIREGRVFTVNTVNIALRTDFYRLKELTTTDLSWVRKLCIDGRSDNAQRAHERWIKFFTAIFDVRERYECAVTRDPNMARAFDEALNNLEEDLHAGIEAKAIPHLNAARGGDLSFLLDDGELASFVHYLAVQTMRTAKMRTNIVAAMKKHSLPGFAPENAWGLLSHIFATNIGASLYSGRNRMRVTLMEAEAGGEFITSDQPVINMRGSISKDDGAEPAPLRDEDFELYYPVSPRLALLVEVDRPTREVSRRRLSATELARYNRAMFVLAHEQAFASREGLLRELESDSSARAAAPTSRV